MLSPQTSSRSTFVPLWQRWATLEDHVAQVHQTARAQKQEIQQTRDLWQYEHLKTCRANRQFTATGVLEPVRASRTSENSPAFVRVRALEAAAKEVSAELEARRPLIRAIQKAGSDARAVKVVIDPVRLHPRKVWSPRQTDSAGACSRSLSEPGSATEITEARPRGRSLQNWTSSREASSPGMANGSESIRAVPPLPIRSSSLPMSRSSSSPALSRRVSQMIWEPSLTSRFNAIQANALKNKALIEESRRLIH